MRKIFTWDQEASDRAREDLRRSGLPVSDAVQMKFGCFSTICRLVKGGTIRQSVAERITRRVKEWQERQGFRPGDGA